MQAWRRDAEVTFAPGVVIMIQYHALNPASLDKVAVVQVLEGLDTYAGFAVHEGAGRFYYRNPDNADEIPNGEAYFSEGMLVFANYGAAESILAEIVTQLVALDQDVAVFEIHE